MAPYVCFIFLVFYVLVYAVVLSLIAAVGIVYRKQQFENQLMMNTWKVKWEDIELFKTSKAKDGSTVGTLLFHAVHRKLANVSFTATAAIKTHKAYGRNSVCDGITFESGGDCHHHFFKVEFAIFYIKNTNFSLYFGLWARESYFSCYQ